MPTDGWFKTHRALFTHPLFAGDTVCRGHAFNDLVGMAEFEPTVRGIKGHPVELERGELVASVRFLADRWGWSKGKVQRFMARLESENMVIEVRTETIPGSGTVVGTVYRIVNYALYQATPDGERDGKRDTDGTPAGQIERTKELKNLLTTPEAREAEPQQPDDAPAARSAMWEDFRSRSAAVSPSPSKAEALVRGIIDGDTATAWEMPSGDRVAWADRPRLFRLALDELAASGGKLFNVLRLVVIPREFDPFLQTKSTDRRPRESSNGAGPPALAVPPDPSIERKKLEQDHPELYAEALAEFERCAWWAGEPEHEKARHLRLAIREKTPKVAIVR